MKQQHGIPDARRVNAQSLDTKLQSVTIRDADGEVQIILSSNAYDAGLSPDQARYIARCLLEAADRVEPPKEAPAQNSALATEPAAQHVVNPPRDPQPSFDVVIERMVEELPGLFAAYPKGIKVQTVLERYGVRYDRGLALINEIASRSLGTFVYENGRGHGSKVLVPPNAPPPEQRPLTSAQEAILRELIAAADQHGLTAATRNTARKAVVADGSLGYCLTALEKKGFIMLSKPGKPGGDPPLYQILKTLETIQ